MLKTLAFSPWKSIAWVWMLIPNGIQSRLENINFSNTYFGLPISASCKMNKNQMMTMYRFGGIYNKF